MFKIGDNLIDVIPRGVPKEDFFRTCEEYVLTTFKKEGELHPCSFFWTPKLLTVATWDFENVAKKDHAMNIAVGICKKMGVEQYFFASEAWVKAVPAKPGDDVQQIIDNVSQSGGVRNQPDKMEQVIMILEAKGRPTKTFHFPVFRNGNEISYGKRIVTDSVGEGRAIGIIERASR